jgi:hypothetical protein
MDLLERGRESFGVQALALLEGGPSLAFLGGGNMDFCLRVIAENGHATVCGKPTDEGRVYCSEHWRAAMEEWPGIADVVLLPEPSKATNSKVLVLTTTGLYEFDGVKYKLLASADVKQDTVRESHELERVRVWEHGNQGRGAGCPRKAKPVCTPPERAPGECHQYDCDNTEYFGKGFVIRDKATKKELVREAPDGKRTKVIE